MSQLFVYGSLKRGLANHSELRDARYLRETRTRPAYRLVQLFEYPALDRGELAVEGELYQVSDARLLELDAFEEPHLYRRSEVELEDGTRAFAYFVARELVQPLPVIGARWDG
jgi:gamma-glutamylcyclotransferase (GGCT)/AIG2-like uncharacterized protein YtfP